MNFKNESKRADDVQTVTRTCKCGHRVLVPNRYDFVYCDNCFRRVYRDDRTEFKFKLMEELGEYSNEQIPKQKGRNRRN